VVVVKVELWPWGSEKLKKEIGRMTITNDGTSDNPNIGNYIVRIFRKGSTETVQREAPVTDYRRKTEPVWKLVRLALEAAYKKTEPSS
jgi:hypothetical protein